MLVETIGLYIGGRHCTEYHWYEAVAYPMEASYGPHFPGFEREMPFTVCKRWSFTNPRKTNKLRREGSTGI
jgi:hypothetical protein